MNNSVILTGATGFLGSHLAHSFVKNGYKLVILKRSTSDISKIEDILHKIEVINIDQTSMDDVFKNQSFDFVVHTACTYGRRGESESAIIKTNLVFSQLLLETAIKYSVKTFINTDSLLPRTMNAYSLSKSQFVDWLAFSKTKIQVINMKLEHMYGPGDDEKKFVTWFINQLFENTSEIRLTSGTQKRDFIFIDDVVSSFLTVMLQAEILPIYNEFEVGSGKSIKVFDFINEIYNQYKKINPQCTSKLLFGAISYRNGEIMNVKVNCRDLKKLGWTPLVTISKGVDTVLSEELNK